MNALTLLGLSASTGLASVLWSRLSASSAITTTALSAASYAVSLGVLAVFDRQGASWPPIGLALAYVALSVAVALLWLHAASIASIGTCALAESAYPLVVIVVAWAIGEPTRLSTTGWIGAGLVLVGAPLIAFGGSND